MRRLAVYTYHLKPGVTALEDAVAVKEGFSWPAYMFTGLWMVVHGLWLWLFAVAAVTAAIGILVGAQLLDPIIALAMLVAMQILIGCHGNDWRRMRLDAKGYAMSGVAAAVDRAEADRRFFERVLNGGDALPPPPAAPAAATVGPWS